MSEVTTTSPEAEAYLAAVRDELGHLSEEERGDLLEDLALHLAEVADDDAREEPVGLVARLGAPAEYAAELRAAAGLPARPDAPPARPSGGEGLLEALVRSPAGRLARSVWHHPWAEETRDFLRQLTPAWWVLRGYLVVVVLAWRDANAAADLPLPPLGGSRLLSVVAIAAAVVVSIAVGRRIRRAGLRVLVVAFDVALVLLAVGTTAYLDSRFDQVRYVSGFGPIGHELASPSGPVTNIYPYSRDGQPLADVLLFDQDGRPLRAAAQEWWPDGCFRMADHPRAADGVPVEFAFPLQYGLLPGVPPDRCMATTARPRVPLPTFPAGAGQSPAQSPGG